MYFSLITPAAGREREAMQQRLHGPYRDHQWLWQMFPAPAGTARDFLFRRHEVEGMPRYYVVSNRQPESNHKTWQVQVRDYSPHVATGIRLRSSSARTSVPSSIRPASSSCWRRPRTATDRAAKAHPRQT